MPLSEHEQKLLAQMERALVAEDPKFATSMRGIHRLGQRRRYIIGAVGVLLGLGLVLVGVNTTMWVGAIGFAIMVVAVVYAATEPRHQISAVPGGGSKGGTSSTKRKTRRSKRPGSFMQRLEERWDRRRPDEW